MTGQDRSFSQSKQASPKLPELLAPAGSREAMEAAIRAGADAVYFGGSHFNARMFADNFSGDAMGDAIALCAYHGVKSNVTVNTLPHVREEAALLTYAERLCRWGVDAVICADLGIASLLHKYIPELCLHASTQCMGHNTDAARFFASLGFSRMVCARELSFADIKAICDTSPIETELFIHGAICVSQSGGCLFSSLVGGRSGNRGECAQPCRLPYVCEAGRFSPAGESRNSHKKEGEQYPLSLKDMCLAEHIPALLSLGAASLKIEGRMKSSAYVAGVVSVYRRLLDEGRSADPSEMAFLADLFSRGGFTDGYFRGRIGRHMQGIRREEDKSSTVRAEKEALSGRQEKRRIPVSLTCTLQTGKPATLTLSSAMHKDVTVTVTGDTPIKAEGTPLSSDAVEERLAKLGDTDLRAEQVTVTTEGEPWLPAAALNALRREGAAALETAVRTSLKRDATPSVFVGGIPCDGASTEAETGTVTHTPYLYIRQARYASREQVPGDARDAYDIRYLPIEAFDRDIKGAVGAHINGVVLPPVIFDREMDAIRKMLARATENGVSHILVGNPGHICLARETGAVLHGDLRLNLYTGHTSDVYARAGFTDVLLSPELTAAQMRDVETHLPKGAVTYGRIPLMTLQRCIIREAARVPDEAPCSLCDSRPISILRDRRGICFPMTRAFGHRNVVHNSAPLWMADKERVLSVSRLAFTHHIFTTESQKTCAAVTAAYKRGQGDCPYPEFRRIRP